MAWLGSPSPTPTVEGNIDGSGEAPLVRSVHDRPLPANVIASRRRAGMAFSALAAGLFLARFGFTPGATWCLTSALALSAAALMTRGWALKVLLTLAVAACGAGWYSVRINSTPSDSLQRVLELQHITLRDKVPEPASPRSTQHTLICVEGVAQDTPQRVEESGRGLDRFLHEGTRSRFSLDVRALASDTSLVPASGVVRVWIDGEAPPGVRAGDSVRVSGVFEPPGRPMNPGAMDRRLVAVQDGAQGSLSLSSASLVQRLESPGWWGTTDAFKAAFARARATLRTRARSAVDSMLDDAAPTTPANAPRDDGAQFVRAMILGELTNDADGLRATFIRLGLLHTLCISGFHLAVMAMVTLTLVRLTGDRGWIEPILVAALVLAYAMIVPPNSPVLRSVLMVLLLLCSEALGRRYDRLTMLCWIGVALLLFRPLDLWSLGFQLTFGVTGLLYVVAPVFESRVLGPTVFGAKPGTVGARHRLSRSVRAAFAINFSCWVASAPAILFRTGLASPIAMFGGVVIAPLAVAVLWLGYVALLLGMIVPAASRWMGVLVRPVAHGATWVAATLDQVPWGSVRLPPVSLAWTIVTTVILIAWLRGGWWKRTRAWLLASALIVWLAIEWMGVGVPSNVAARIDMLSVGDGSCVLVRSGRDAILWDAGSLTAGLGSRDIPTALRTLGVWRVPTIVVTHPDLDHYGLLPDLIRPLGVKNVVLGQRFLDRAAQSPQGPESYLLGELALHGVRVDVVAAGARLSLGSRDLVFLAPKEGATFALDNEHSLVALVVPRGATGEATADAILTGDLAKDGITDLDTREPALHASVLELPHHGSADARAIDWVGKVSPAVVLQSTGPKRVDDPRWSLVRSNCHWLCTAKAGAAWAEIGIDGTVRTGSFAGPADQ